MPKNVEISRDDSQIRSTIMPYFYYIHVYLHLKLIFSSLSLECTRILHSHQVSHIIAKEWLWYLNPNSWTQNEITWVSKNKSIPDEKKNYLLLHTLESSAHSDIVQRMDNSVASEGFVVKGSIMIRGCQICNFLLFIQTGKNTGYTCGVY